MNANVFQQQESGLKTSPRPSEYDHVSYLAGVRIMSPSRNPVQVGQCNVVLSTVLNQLITLAKNGHEFAYWQQKKIVNNLNSDFRAIMIILILKSISVAGEKYINTIFDIIPPL